MSTIIEILGSNSPAAARTDLNANFNALNVDKVEKVGTPVDNQIGVWTGNGTIDGDAGFTFDGGLNVTVADAENKVGLTINQNDTTNDKLALEVNGPAASGAAKVSSSTLVQYNDTDGGHSDWAFNVAGDGYPSIMLQSTGGTFATPLASATGTKSTIETFAYDNTNTQYRASRIRTNVTANKKTNIVAEISIGNLTSDALTLSSTNNIEQYTARIHDVYGSTILKIDSGLQQTGGGDLVGKIDFAANNTTPSEIIFSSIASRSVVATAGNETGKITINTIASGTISDRIDILGSATAGIVQSSGYTDLILQTGNPTTGNITIVDGANGNINIAPNGTGRVQGAGVSIPTISSTDTFTNKRMTKRTGTTTSSATPTINTDNVDEYYITAQTVAITSMTTNLTGTPTLGQTLFISIIGTAARAITWGASFANGPVALPTTTTTTLQLSTFFKWDGSVWRCYATGSTV